MKFVDQSVEHVLTNNRVSMAALPKYSIRVETALKKQSLIDPSTFSGVWLDPQHMCIRILQNQHKRTMPPSCLSKKQHPTSASSQCCNLSTIDYDVWGQCDHTEYFRTHEHVEILPSQLGGLGAFVKSGETVRKGDVVSWYPGNPIPLIDYDQTRNHGLQVRIDF